MLKCIKYLFLFHRTAPYPDCTMALLVSARNHQLSNQRVSRECSELDVYLRSYEYPICRFPRSMRAQYLCWRACRLKLIRMKCLRSASHIHSCHKETLGRGPSTANNFFALSKVVLAEEQRRRRSWINISRVCPYATIKFTSTCQRDQKREKVHVFTPS